jgi:hypothetical protein
MTSLFSSRAAALAVASLVTCANAPALAAPSAPAAGPSRVTPVRAAPHKPESAKPTNRWTWQMSMSRGRLGVQVLETTPELRRHLAAPADAGLLVSRVEKGSAAAKAGVRVGDVVVSVAGKPVSSSWDVMRALTGKRQGERVHVAIVRDKQKRSLSVVMQRDALGGWSWSTRADGSLSAERGDLDFDLEVPGFPGLRNWLEKMQPGDVPVPSRERTLERRLKQLERRLKQLERRRRSPAKPPAGKRQKGGAGERSTKAKPRGF